MKQKIHHFVSTVIRSGIIVTGIALATIVAWEQVDDRIESKWHTMTTVEYHRGTTTTPVVELKSEEAQRIEEIKESEDAQDALDAYAKGVYAEELRKKAESLAQEARASSSVFE